MANFPDAQVELVRDSGGTFKVFYNDEVIFDKLAISQTLAIFPKPDEISDIIFEKIK